MADVTSDKGIPRRMLEMLRMFLAASSDGETALLVLESRNGKMTTKFRSVEASGSPVPTPPEHKKKNPARARRSKLRLDTFIRKKEEARKLQTENRDSDAGETRSAQFVGTEEPRAADKLIFDSGLPSPIPQLDGESSLDDQTYSFKSDYGQEDIDYTLSEIFPENETILASRIRITPKGADHFCTVVVKGLRMGDGFWPMMSPEDAKVIREVSKM